MLTAYCGDALGPRKQERAPFGVGAISSTRDVGVPFGKKVSVSSMARVTVTAVLVSSGKSVERGQSGRAAADVTKRWVVLSHVSHRASFPSLLGAPQWSGDSAAQHLLPARIAPRGLEGGRGRRPPPSAVVTCGMWWERDPQQVSSSS